MTKRAILLSFCYYCPILYSRHVALFISFPVNQINSYPLIKSTPSSRSKHYSKCQHFITNKSHIYKSIQFNSISIQFQFNMKQPFHPNDQYTKSLIYDTWYEKCWRYKKSCFKKRLIFTRYCKKKIKKKLIIGQQMKCCLSW